MSYLMDTAQLHGYYSAQSAALCKRMEQGFAADLDKFARTLVCGLWRCHKLCDEHTAAINEIYSKGQPHPNYLYWELVSAATSDKPIAIPDFFRAQAILDRALGQNVCGDIAEFLRALLLRLCSSELASEETAYISNVSNVLKRAAASENITLFDETIMPTGGKAEPVQLRSESGAVTAKAPSAKEESTEPVESVEDLLAELDELVGMEQIKKDVRSLINLIKVRKLRQENGLAVPDLSLHMVFTGNPGTGKTTVARLLSRLYKAIGVLENGTLVEVDRSALVAGYVGQTALKTREALDKALGGILFIDEAYSLAPEGNGNDFGKEAIETILKVMEDERDELVVIAAGYPEPMERFISSNPGLESRFGKYFHFEDYNGEQLFEIFLSQCKKNEYAPDEAASEYAKKLFTELYENRDDNFGNARDVRNIFEKAVARHSDRVAAMNAPTRDDLLTLIEADLYPEAN